MIYSLTPNHMNNNYSLTDRLISKASQNKTPLNGSFELTASCNFNCRMCYIHNCSKKELQKNIIPYEKWSSLFGEAYKLGLFYVLLTGGEPLTHPQFEDIYSDIYSRGMLTILNTNGYLINSDIIKLFKKHKPSRINITLYGSDNETYKNLCSVENGFSVVSENIKMLKDLGFNLKINMTVVKSNVHQTDDILAFAKELSIPVTPTTYVFSTADNCSNERLTAKKAARVAVEIFEKMNTKEAFINKYLQTKAFLDLGRKSASTIKDGISCHAGSGSYWVHCDGKFGFCGMGQLENEPNVFEIGFENAWKTAVKNAGEYRLPIRCKTCEYRFVCGRCFAKIETDGVPINSDTYTCEYYKEYADYLILRGEVLHG